MIDFRPRQWNVNLVAMLGLLGIAMSLYAQSPTPKSDADQIAKLMAALADHSKTPSDVLDPDLSPSEREKNLRHFNAPHYEISLVPTAGIPTVTGDSASVPIRVHFNAEGGNSLDASATARFVRRSGTWYFSDFDFMSWPAILITALVVCVIVGVGYAATVLVLRNRLLKRGPLGVNGVKMFLPFFWPSLFHQTS